MAQLTDSPRLTVIGEALIDLVPLDGPESFHARPGGSPFNVAVGLARLGHPTSLMARLADNAFGRILREHARTEGIDLAAAPHAVEPTTLAVVSLDQALQASYDFYVDGTADWQWTPTELSRLDLATQVLHFGSIASWTAPGADLIDAAVTGVRARGDVLVSYDPNVRPLLLGEPARARDLVERSVAASHLVKASREDVEWLYAGASVEHVAARWLELGPLLVVVTDGEAGAHAYRPEQEVLSRPGRQVTVADTVGAGDSFTSALLSGLVRRGLHAPSALARAAQPDLLEVLDEAVLVSASTCERIGADPPRIADLPALRSRPMP